MTGAADTAAPALRLTGIEKRFGSVSVLSGVDLEVDAGEVHALLGENGAGKTTLMNIASGLLRPDGGEIAVDGRPVVLRSPREGFKAGIGLVHQSYRLVGKFTVAENLHLGWDEAPPYATAAELESRAAVLADRFGLAVDPAAPANQLSIGEQQRVAILRTLVRGAKTLVLDEPTAALTPLESEQLFTIIRGLIVEGHSVIFISHKLREVMEIADRITVLRGGKRIAGLPVAEATTEKLARLMVGESLQGKSPDRGLRRAPQDAPVALRAESLSALDERDHRALRSVTFDLHHGEILGIAGVSGNGQRELAEVLTGLRVPSEGTVEVDGGDLAGCSPKVFIEAGIGHIPEDPRTGLAFSEPLDSNAVLKSLEDPALRRGPLLMRGRMRRRAAELLRAADLASLKTDRRVGTLSGGQAQRLLVHRELAAGTRVLIAVHPTRGLDVAASQNVSDALLRARADGIGVLLISEDLDEVLALSDRIVVLYEGTIMATLTSSAFDRDQVGALMGGIEGDRGAAVAPEASR